LGRCKNEEKDTNVGRIPLSRGDGREGIGKKEQLARSYSSTERNPVERFKKT